MAHVLTMMSADITREKAGSFSSFIASAEAHDLRVAEINSCGQLHPFLQRLSKLCYSEYGSNDSSIRSEDLMSLSYASESFDLVLTSDTLEHVPDVRRASAEIWRVLKYGGFHVFTVPVVWDREVTLQRCHMEGEVIVSRHLDSYHGGALGGDRSLVFYEFGSDIVNVVASCRFEVSLFTSENNPAVSVFVCRKTDSDPLKSHNVNKRTICINTSKL
ncbi:MAG: class I SAM-dependent methyltransferase [bacterium]